MIRISYFFNTPIVVKYKFLYLLLLYHSFAPSLLPSMRVRDDDDDEEDGGGRRPIPTHEESDDARVRNGGGPPSWFLSLLIRE